MLHPSAFVIHGDIDEPLSSDHLQLLADGYKLKYVEHDLPEERIAEVKFQLFHESRSDSFLLDEGNIISNPVMIRTNGEVILTSNGKKVGDIRNLLS